MSGPARARRSIAVAGLFLLTLAAGCRTGGAGKPASSPLPAEDAAPGPFLWEVAGPNGPVFLYGTIHILGGEDVPPVAVDRFAGAPALMLEADLKTIDPVAMVSRGMLPPDQSLDALLGPKLWPQMVERVGATVPELALRRLKPWLAASLLIASIIKPPALAMDQWFQQRAVEQNKELLFLEKVDDQFAVLERTFDVATIEEILKDVQAQKNLIEGLSAAYRKGDVRAVETGLMMSYGSARKQMEALFDERNQRWLAAIDRLRAGKGGFVAVGAGHLGGEKGLVALLRARGLSVRRVLPG